MNLYELYALDQGTPIGEIRHEIFSKYGEIVSNSAHYGWHSSEILNNQQKTYSLVKTLDSVSPVKFLVATITYQPMDLRGIDPKTKKKVDVPPVFGPDISNPSHLHLEWIDTDIPFLPKDEIDKKGISYTLP